MKICFLVNGCWRNPHAGAVRPFITWAGATRGHETSVALLKAGSRMLDGLKETGIPYGNFSSVEELSVHLKSARPDIVVADDNPPQLKISRTLGKKTGIPFATYAQILLGTQSIVDAIDGSGSSMIKRVRHRLSAFVPFSAFRTAYKGLVGSDTPVIGNSRTTATLLQAFYGVEPEGVVYPPLDRQVFRPRKSGGRDGALLYIGSFGLDTDCGLIGEIIRTLRESGKAVAVFGNRELGPRLARDYGVEFLDRCTDDELALRYSSSVITVCPQKWELFGYVPAESISCGTPVLAYDCMGPGEVLSRHGGGVLVNRKAEFLSALRDIDQAAKGAPRIDLDSAGFNSERSAAHLASILERVRGGRR